MKSFWFLLLLPMTSFAIDCKVDGISDSPQKLRCSIYQRGSVETLKLSCLEGVYKMEWLGKNHDVSVAYHEDVETGSSPLVFLSEEISLTAVAHKIYHRASLRTNGKEFKGVCFKK